MNKLPAARALATLIAASGATFALAQQPAPPSFAPSNTSAQGARSMAANCAMCHGPDAEKRKRADFVVESDKGLDHARAQVAAIVDGQPTWTLERPFRSADRREVARRLSVV